MEESRLFWLALHLLLYDRLRHIRRILDHFSSIQDLFEARRGDLERLHLPATCIDAILTGDALERALKELEKIRGKAYTLLTFEDRDYPAYLKEIFDPPLVIYCEGQVEAIRCPAVAIVGSRKPTPYGRAIAEKLGRDLAACGCVVISGLARGIDSCGHWGALSNGRTIAVLGSGLDVCYPRENRGLARKIAERGAILTEFPLGTRPLSQNFPVRNRIISGLSLSLVVVEAAERSGSLISARLAVEQNREVLAVPGNVTSDLSRGTHKLLKMGAGLVESWEDVVEDMPSPWREKCLAKKKEKGENKAASLSREEKSLLTHITEDTLVHIDTLAEKTDRSISELLVLLLGLEMKGEIVQHPGKYFQRRI